MKDRSKTKHLFSEGKDAARNNCVYLWCEVFIPFPIKNMETAFEVNLILYKCCPLYFSLQDRTVKKVLLALVAALGLSGDIYYLVDDRQLEDQIGPSVNWFADCLLSVELETACLTDLLAISSMPDSQHNKNVIFPHKINHICQWLWKLNSTEMMLVSVLCVLTRLKGSLSKVYVQN